MTKLKRQMKSASPSAQQLMAEMLWALLLFPSNMKARTKRRQVNDLWALNLSDHAALVVAGHDSGRWAFRLGFDPTMRWPDRGRHQLNHETPSHAKDESLYGGGVLYLKSPRN